MKTEKELNEIFKKIEQSVQDKARKAGAPIFYIENGKRIRQEPTGERYIQVIDSDGNLTDYKL
ncbi:hypothetical protein GC096_35425 [Paenibacillus sp. LMG 31461]|jgi:hypothetical protein|uniref:Uncharacterized protein n=1 Tax=Paenibacillus plantarum TaxID=2654975 RepID=A0ABX1XL93_9BACL|nr:hypothetical protein [Paenibacillus plantarum]NOU69310.1 hypothetical protein [Paenibacillus plantarum]